LHRRCCGPVTPEDVMPKPGRPPDDESSAPESGTVRDPDVDSAPADRGIISGPGGSGGEKDDPSVAGEER
jgi:hypothetical protein